MDELQRLQETNDLLTKSIVDIMSETYRFKRVFVKAVSKLEVEDQKKYASQFAWFTKRVDKAAENAGLSIVDLSGQEFDPGMAVTAMNIDDFEPEDDSVMILVPGLSFDDAGNRIGYGKGYYDRFLAGFEAESFVKSAGICYMECKEKKVTKALSPEEKALTKGGIPVGKGDIRTDFVITV